jgi:hypothetical protein
MQAKPLVAALQMAVAPCLAFLGHVSKEAVALQPVATAALGMFCVIQLKTMVVTAFV